MGNTRILYSENLKQKILTLYHLGHSVNELSKKYYISKSTIYNWIRNYSPYKDLYNNEIFIEEYQKLLAEIKQLKTENTILQKAISIISRTL